ncbi:hypothetical protein BDQ12DRAFT_600261 [Crucibulum laeve]|uniref:von Willebrand factor type A domain-containing protein n=1 Tax=Crucibulum laeve TaxID=68775 RepID=A0A5C3MI90_9AGAR|nr:hypothetical protein BDQ12DRAFT_600261 [Crucibulum laeve]
MNPSGIIYSSTTLTPDIRSLPLKEVRIKALIVDVSARVTVTQVFTNPSDIATGRCKYCFPVPACAAICAFNMRTSDGRTLIGISKEKDLARDEYEQGIKSGKFAGMLEYVTDDISIGSILAQAVVETKLVYVMDLANEENPDEARFQLPMHIGQRYGIPPAALLDSDTHLSHTRIKLTADIQTSGPIKRISSPSHPNSISETKYSTHLGRPSRRRTTVKFRSSVYLEQDFVLIVHADGLDSPRCFAELKHNASHADTVAMQVTLVPKFLLPRITSQEYVFLVDRSGSMGGDRIETAKRTLVLLLRMLPTSGTSFNVFSFGYRSSSLWQRSCTYDQTSLLEATDHVDSMSANYGPGTEIRSALHHVLSSHGSAPQAVFVLTDGEAYDIDQTAMDVADFVTKAPSNAPIRVFTLGIGSTASSAMCEAIARAGNGICLFALDTESIVGKCARLFRAGRTPFLRNVVIDWGFPAKLESDPLPSVTFSNLRPNTRIIDTRPLPQLQQVPVKIQALHAGSRTTFFAILSMSQITIPEVVKLRGQLDSTGEPFEHHIPVRGLQLAGVDQSLPLIHTIAAWRLVQEHQIHRAPLPRALGVATDEEIRKSVIVQLGERYQLVTPFTSFVAVDSVESTSTATGIRDTFFSRALNNRRFRNVRQQDHTILPRLAAPSFLPAIVLDFLSFFSSQQPLQLHSHSTTSEDIPGAWPGTTRTSVLPTTSGLVEEDAEESGYTSAGTFSTLSSLEPHSDWSSWSDSSSDSQLSTASEHVAESPRIEPLSLAPEAERIQHVSIQHGMLKKDTRIQATQPIVQREILELLRLQHYDGSFRLNDSLRQIIGSRAVEAGAGVNGAAEDIWATVLAMTFIKKHMNSQKELLDDILMKINERLDGVSNIEDLMRRAEACFG